MLQKIQTLRDVEVSHHSYTRSEYERDQVAERDRDLAGFVQTGWHINPTW
jgi:hypothetical protein